MVKINGKLIRDLYPSVCGKLYKRQLFDKIRFKRNIWYEDVELLTRLYLMINKLSIIEQPLYYYIQRESSITYTYSDKLRDLINNWQDIINYYKGNNAYQKYKSSLEFSFVRYAYATFIKRLSKSNDKKKFNEGVKFAINKVNEYFPDYKKNEYLSKRSCKNIYLKNFNMFFANIIYYLERNKKN